MTKDLLLAIDVGTGSARVALVSDSGKILAFAAREYSQIVPHYGWSQQRPQLWWEGVVFGIRRVIEQIDDERALIFVVTDDDLANVLAEHLQTELVRVGSRPVGDETRDADAF